MKIIFLYNILNFKKIIYVRYIVKNKKEIYYKNYNRITI